MKPPLSTVSLLSPALVLAALSAQSSPRSSADERAEVPVLLARTGVLRIAPDRAILHLGRLGLGSGGCSTDLEASRSTHEGRGLRTPGGVHVLADRAGILVRFPYRDEDKTRDLLIAPDGFVHLRDGGVGEPDADGRIALYLADGSVVTVQAARPGSAGLTAVTVSTIDLELPVVLWGLDEARAKAAEASTPRRRRSVRRRASTRHRSFGDLPVGTVWYALGDGRSIYRPVPSGPLVVLESVVAPAEPDPREPLPASAAVVVVGDVLEASLRELPRVVGRQRIQFPQAREVVLRLARDAGKIFRKGVSLRPPGGLGDLLIPLGEDFLLSVEVLDAAKMHGSLRLGLTKRGATAPVIEWVVRNGKTTAHLVRPAAGSGDGPRYFLRGHDISGMVDGLVPAVPVDPTSGVRARQLLRRLGARDPELAEQASGR